jgi:hypothetical protein
VAEVSALLNVAINTKALASDFFIHTGKLILSYFF